jgi:subfamily B ATP-binding cassette protein MsbA
MINDLKDKTKNQKKTNSFSNLLRIAKYVVPFKWLMALQIVLNTIFSFLNTVSVTLILPILELIFSDGKVKSETVESTNPLNNITDSFFDFMYNLIGLRDEGGDVLYKISALIIVVFALKNIFKYMAGIVSTKLEEGIIKSIRDKVFAKLTDLSVDFFSANRQGNLISILTNDVQVINSSTLNSLTVFLREIVQVLLFLLVLLSISPILTLIAFSTSIISFFLIRAAMKFLRRYAGRMQAAMGEYTSTLSETITGIRVIKAYNAEDTANEKFSKETEKYVLSSVKHRKIIELIPTSNEFFAIFALCVVLFVGGGEVLNGQMQPEKLMLFLFALFSIMSPVATIVNSISRFQHGFVAAERVFSVLDYEPKVMPGTEKISDFKEKIEIKELVFSYDNSHVIDGVSLILPKSRKIAFVGSSGSGKSTMLDLVIRFYDPKSGEIEIDGRDIRMLDTKSYRSLFGIVGQENMLFNDSIRNNIKYGFKSATEEQIINAAKKSNAYDFIMKTKNGFDTIVGDRGVTLSGGERQRIAIARALIREPQILIFDEATSALDAESEKIVQAAINKSLADKTAIIVAHRLATIIDCDMIYVFDKGKIVESGTHKELIAQTGIYKMLYDLQFTQAALKV